jgi:hypothetical protein
MMKAFETLTVSNSTKSLNPEIFKHGLEKSQSATIDVQLAGIRYRTDGGSPLSSLGLVANAGDIIELVGYNDVNLFRAIRISSVDAELNVDYS